MRKTKQTSKIIALILTLTLCMSLGTSVYAAENNNIDSLKSAIVPEVSTQPRGMVVTAGSTNLSGGTGEIFLTLDSDVWGAEFMFSVLGNPSGEYHCNVQRLENNYYYSIGDVKGDGHGVTLPWPWLQKGTYKFYIYTTNQNYGAASAIAQIFD